MTDKKLEQQMISFIYNNNTDGIKTLVKDGFNLEQTLLNSNMTPLMFAAYGNSIKSAEVLIELGANINALDYKGATPLIHATLGNSIDVVRLLLSQNGINIDAKTNEPIYFDYSKLDDNAIAFVDELGFGNNKLISEGVTALETSIFLNRNDNVISNMLIDKGADISYKTNILHNPIILSALTDNVEIAQRILFKCGYISEKKAAKSLILPFMAICNNSNNFLEYYLQNVRITETEYITIFLEATRIKAYSCISVLLKNFDELEPLLSYLVGLACINNDIQFLDIVMQFNYNINKVFLDETTPLAIACFSSEENDELIIKLLEYGANINTVDKYGMTALMYAAMKNKINIINLLIERGAEVSKRDKLHKTYKEYLLAKDNRSWGELTYDRIKDLKEQENGRDDEIPACRQSFYDRFDWYLQKYLERNPDNPISEIYKNVDLDRKIFSKIRCRKLKSGRPERKTVLLLALGFQLTLNETEDFMNSAGYYFSDKDKHDIQIKKLLSERNYTISDWSNLIYEKTQENFFKYPD